MIEFEVEALPIKKEGIKKQPDFFEVNIKDKILLFKFYCNIQGGFFTFDIFNKNGDPIVSGRKLVLAVDMIGRLESKERQLPDAYIVPLPLTREAQQEGITMNNLNEDVKIYILPKGGD